TSQGAGWTLQSEQRAATFPTRLLGFPDRRNRSERMGHASNPCKIEPRVLREAPKLKWLRVEVCPMSPGWAQALGSAHVTRAIIATAGVATLVVGRAGVAMAAGPPIGTSVTTPAGKAAVSTTTGSSGVNGNAQVTGAGPT